MSIIEINAKNERTLKMYSNLIEEIIRSHTDKNKFNTGFSFFKIKSSALHVSVLCTYDFL